MATIRLRIAATVGAAALAVVGLSACETADAPPEAAESAPAATNGEEQPAEDPAPADTEAEADADTADDPADNTAGEANQYQPDGLPDDLPDIGVPFYQPSALMAVTSEGDPWVLEFVTDDALDVVNDAIAAQFSEANGWEQLSQETYAEQDQTVTTGSRDGYQLVIAVSPERVEQQQTSLFYTLSTQQ